VQAVSNVVGNAVKFTPSGGHVSVTTARVDGDAVIRVRDDGAGIDPALLPRIFDLFVQAPMALDRSTGGLGIGLTLARRMIELHGGSIAASSAGPGEGSEFIITLPVVPHSTRRAPSAVGSPGKSIEILLVEDNADAAESFGMLLEIDGHTVRTVGSGRGALAAMDDHGAHVAFVDIGLPEMDGFEVARRLRAHPHGHTMVLVALSGYGSEEDRRRGAAAGFDHYFTKPVDVADVRRLLQGLAGEGGRPMAVVRDISSRTPRR
jgi:CheY-like chemotaxis protein